MLVTNGLLVLVCASHVCAAFMGILFVDHFRDQGPDGPDPAFVAGAVFAGTLGGLTALYTCTLAAFPPGHTRVA